MAERAEGGLGRHSESGNGVYLQVGEEWLIRVSQAVRCFGGLSIERGIALYNRDGAGDLYIYLDTKYVYRIHTEGDT